MRIAHIVTYLSPGGEFGGPVRVAQAQAASLVRLGHTVEIFAGAPVQSATVEERNGVTTRLFPAKRIHRSLGFAGMTSSYMRNHLRAAISEFDLVHIHFARDLVTIPAALIAIRSRTPLVLQTHGMIDRSTRILAHVVDFFWTKSILRSAAAVLTLTHREVEDVRLVEGASRVRPIRNGVSIVDGSLGGSQKNLVLFMARLHPRKRPDAFVEMAAMIAQQHPNIEFAIAGPDEGELANVSALIVGHGIEDRVQVLGPIDPEETDEILRSARVYVLPSVDEVFPMTILEAFRALVPVVTTDSLGIARECEEFGAAELTDGSPIELARAVIRVIEDSAHAAGLVAGGRRYLEERLNMDEIVGELVSVYEEAKNH